jgi:predicted enzyme related to lactoylglutathione lyase
MPAKTNPVNWFEIPANDLERAREFYEAALGFKLEVHDMGVVKMAWFPEMIMDAYGATGSLVKGEGYVPSHDGTLVYFPVEDIEGTLAKVIEAGGKTLLPKMSIGQYGFIGHFEDTEGNKVGLHSMK